MNTDPTGEKPTDEPTETVNPQLTNDGEKPQDKPADSEKPKTVEELQAELETVQNQLHDANRQAAKRRKELDAFEKAQKAKEDAEKTELQKAQDDLAEANAKLEKAQAAARRHDVLSAVRSAGQKLKVLLNEDAISDLYDAGHFDDVETDDAGKPQNVDTFLKVLIKSKPYVLEAKAASAPDIGADRGGGNSESEFDKIRQKREELNKKDAKSANWMEQAGVAR
jgi:hypothetical protein